MNTSLALRVTKLSILFGMLSLVNSLHAEFQLNNSVELNELATASEIHTNHYMTTTNSAATPLLATDFLSESGLTAGWTFERTIIGNFVYVRLRANASVTGSWDPALNHSIANNSYVTWIERTAIRWTNAIPIGGSPPTGGTYRQAWAVIGSIQIPSDADCLAEYVVQFLPTEMVTEGCRS